MTAKCYGGDYSRKRKLLERYKEGKKKLRAIGKVQIHKDTFINVMKQWEKEKVHNTKKATKTSKIRNVQT